MTNNISLGTFNPLDSLKTYYRISIDYDDDYFTSLDDVAKEVMHHKNEFADKTFLCCCHDDISAFGEFFMSHFADLNLKKLILTGYTTEYRAQDMVIEMTKKGTATFSSISTKGSWAEFVGDADIVVTNPPAYMAALMVTHLSRIGKKFLLIADLNTAMYSTVFPFIVTNEVWLGVTRPSKFYRGAKGYVTSDKPVRFGNKVWLTNLENDISRQSLTLTQRFHDPENAGRYLLVDDTDILWVSRVKDIPIDWAGKMAVPINYLQVHDPLQFEIVGEVNHGKDNIYDIAKPIVNGEMKYKHVVIRPTKPLDE